MRNYQWGVHDRLKWNRRFGGRYIKHAVVAEIAATNTRRAAPGELLVQTRCGYIVSVDLNPTHEFPLVHPCDRCEQAIALEQEQEAATV